MDKLKKKKPLERAAFSFYLAVTPLARVPEEPIYSGLSFGLD
jgi:hypothetical protein